jgi:hypothetical protein
MSTAIFDIEADGFVENATQVWCVVIKDLESGTVYTYRPGDRSFLDALSRYPVVCGHNVIAYDLPLLRKLYGWEYTGQVIDTLLISRTQRPNRTLPPDCKNRSAFPHSVEAWAYRLGMKPKIVHEDWTQFSEGMLDRCVHDVEIQHGILKALRKEGEGEGWENAHKLNSRLFRYLQLQEEYGWTADRDHIVSCMSYLDRAIHRIDRVIRPRLPVIVEVMEKRDDTGEWTYLKKPFKKSGAYSEAAIKYAGETINSVTGPFSRLVFRPVDPDSNAELKDFLLGLGWIPKEWNTNNEGERTSPKLSKDDNFEGVQGSLGRLLVKRTQCKQRKSVLEGWLNAIRPDGRITPKVGGIASTGRLRHAVIVNVPSPATKSFFAKQMRKVFIAKPGWVLIGVDSKGNQMRQLAARMQDDEFTKAVLYGNSKDGTDLHSLNQRRSGVPTRTLAKNFFYGCILFGAGDKKTGKVINGTPEQGKRLKEEYFRQMPALRELIDRLTAEWRKTARIVGTSWSGKKEYRNGYIKGLDGRPILVEYEKDILVYYLQSDEAIQMAAAYCWTNKQLEKRGYVWGKDYGFVIWYHDEFQIECRPEIKEEVMAVAIESIKWAGEFYNIKCPHEGEGKIGLNWCETH